MPASSSHESTAKSNILQVLVFLTAVVCRLPALRTWWCLDDWGQLSRAAGLVPDEFGARWLSQVLWWEITGNIGGLNPDIQTWFRIIIHAFSATTVLRIGRLLNLTVLAQTFAGVFFAATPIAFTVIFWASGIQELLAGLFALLAIERWLHKGVGNAAGGLALGVCSLLAKESGFGLPFLFLLLTASGRGGSAKERKPRQALLMVLFIAVVLEGLLVLRHFSRDAGDPYQLGGPGVLLGNLGMYGWWLCTPGPIFASRITVPMGGLGIGLFVAWSLWGVLSWRRKQDLPLVLFTWGALALGPALLLVRQAHPYLAYLTVAALALSLGSLIPRRWSRGWVVAAIVLLGGVWGYGGMRTRIENVTDNGHIADPVVRAAFLAEESAGALSARQSQRGGVDRCRYAILQPPMAKSDAAKATQEGPAFVEKSPRFMAMGGTIGPALILGCQEPVLWVNSLVGIEGDCRIFCETGQGFIDWGGMWTGLLYSALLDVSLGHFDRAVLELEKAAAMDDEFAKFEFDERKIPGWSRTFAGRKEEFRTWLRAAAADGGSGGIDARRLETLFSGLLQSVAGSGSSP